MPFTVFFAWQMDTPIKLNRWFIETAIKSAIKKLKSELRQEQAAELKLEPALPVEPDEPSEANPDPDPADAEIVYQWGAHGHVGASMIAETILERIEACGVFIADLTFTGHVTTGDGREKKLPNANVLIELGAASRTGNGWDRMILVMNTRYGPVDDLPFDLRHRQCQVKYTLADGEDLERTKKAKQLAEDITAQLRPMYQDAMRRAAEGRRKREAAILDALTDRKAKVEVERATYEQKLLSKSYRNFKAQTLLLVVTVFPIEPQRIPTQSDGYYYQHRLAPISNEQGIVKHEMKSELCFWPSEDQPPNAITELTDEGSIYAVRNLLWHFVNQPAKPKTLINFKFRDFESDIVQAVQRYMNCVKELGQKGPWFVGVSVLNVRGFRMAVGEWASDGWFISDSDPPSIQTDLLAVPPNLDTSKEEVVAEVLKPAFRQVWRAFHLPGRPNFHPDGTPLNFDG